MFCEIINKENTKINKKCDVCGTTESYKFYNLNGQIVCNKHYLQWYRHGKFLTRTRFDKNSFIEKDDYMIMELYDSHGEKTGECKIDKDDVEKITHIKWYLKNSKTNQYIYGKKNSKNILLHRLIYFGENNMTNDLIVDHIDGNGLNNTKSNLRECNHKENIRNMHKDDKVIGVGFDSTRNKWRAQITVDYKNIFIGRFNSREEAIIARLDAEKKYFKEFSSQNTE